MKAEYEDDMLPEYDFSNAIRGKFAGRWIPEQRERLLRESIAGTARAWHEFALTRVQALEATLFTLLVLRRNADHPSTKAFDSRPSHALGTLRQRLGRCMSLSPRFNRRLEDLARECEWVVEHGSEGMEGEAAERLVHAERLERIGREAESLKTEGDSLIRSELAGLGLSVHEIEQKTEETARLWRAA